MRICILLAALLCHGIGQADENAFPGWRDDPITRIKALALLQTLNATLLSNPSATITLQNWCADHKMAGDPRIRAIRDQATHKPADAAIREQLRIDADEPVGYRRVQLVCGAHIFSEADNWYVKSRLTTEMNKVLDSSDTPFGLAVKALKFNRKTLSSTQIWSPLPAGWEMRMPVIATSPSLAIPEQVLKHRALLSREDGTPFSLVIETYRRDLFAFSLDTDRNN
ncbi:TPA: hypothetical protein ACSP1Y_004663 [Aeromonas hydrophila]|uniref:hypothetical protein n=1 Tax=Aeromonas hydrophila TaxID=644 RepID=UPI0038D0330E